MDTASASAIAAAVSGAASSVGTEAGRHAWESLLALCRRVGGRQPGDGIALPEDEGDEEQVRVLTTRVIEESERDGDFAAGLESWAAQHGFPLRVDSGSVSNTISGDARVSGPVIQGRDFSGPITFGG
ncbi:hypothetical protein DB35_19000 [Streptomyces abyssalis]|uniref:Uncharacterized protein n=1 Tax=Streptomyces abyssalis TaxID=933944 RepID=A0A1E7JLB0_9ACTN|nr:hypothetical protein [Streptomyces abyssalis]OEU88399.1 hypothetical protein AN215_20145 [Streptomyces abyssalis]OEU89136.1 hypothetical protein DB35_19000 [Streptomyces abyssalis]OEV29946.1 hypothetical protein AN219_13735 [Streptomyces nanshensis]